ncbi:MAG: hypothetical protein JWQ93_1540 [Marmoricola sp.]|jgi:uncharacterized protein YacL|nr:hypothetical protein [Marmoricola sp.]MCW2837474.1 hypothetical protein [Marmoricola sp.]
MGFGLGIVLLVVGLALALAVDAQVSGVDVQTLGWILALGGLIVIGLTAVQLNTRRRATAVRTTTHSDGTQTQTERRTEMDPPAAL